MNNESERQATEEEIRNFYDAVYYKDVDADYVPSAHLRRLADSCYHPQRPDVLDVACGAGSWLRELYARGARPSGIDISEKAIAVCRKAMPDGRFHIGSAETLPFADGQFDLVSCLGSLEHFLDQEKALREMVRVAKDNAVFIILVPNSGFLTRRFGLYGGTHQAAVREVARSLGEWQQLFTTAGLRIERRWKDLHVLSWSWIRIGPWYLVPIRVLQALALAVWPLSWQYQVYHLCRKK